MAEILTLSATFAVEDEESTDLQSLLSKVETRMRQVTGTYDCFADVAASVKRYTIVVELEGENVDPMEANNELDTTIRESINRFAEEPICFPPLTGEV